jgi:hypothetical protein
LIRVVKIVINTTRGTMPKWAKLITEGAPQNAKNLGKKAVAKARMIRVEFLIESLDGTGGA